MKDWFKILFLAAFILAIVIGWPLAVIFALNILFSLSIAFTSETWLAAFILLLAVNGVGSTFRK